MISQAEIKNIRKLQSKKGRKLHNLILVEGKRLCGQLLEYNLFFEKIWVTEKFKKSNESIIKKINLSTKIDIAPVQDLSKICTTKNPSGIAGLINIPKPNHKKISNRIIILDDISDPGNMGTILRTARWFGVKTVLLSNGCVDPYNSKVIRSAMGAHFKMNVIFCKIDEQIKKLKDRNFQIISADVKGSKSIVKFKPNRQKWALVLGNEAHGLSSDISKLVDEKIKIFKKDEIESLNVSVACGIFLYHFSV